MAAITPQSITRAAPSAPTYVAAAGGGDTVVPAADFFVVKNGGGSTITVTIAPTGTTSYGVALPNLTVSVPNGSERWINLNDGSYVNSTGVIPITYSGVTTVTVGAFYV